MKYSLIAIILLHLTFVGSAQEDMDIGYTIRGNYMKPILKESLIDVKTISDINSGYPISWISKHISSEITTSKNNTDLTALSANDTLSSQQLKNLKSADIGTNIEVHVKYIPSHSQKENELKEINFKYTVIPDVEAEFPGGIEKLNQYLKEHTVDKISKKLQDELKLATVIFSISKEGQITDTELRQTSEIKEVDDLLIEVINNMPTWKPAENADGTKTPQEFKFDIGYMIGC